MRKLPKGEKLAPYCVETKHNVAIDQTLRLRRGWKAGRGNSEDVYRNLLDAHNTQHNYHICSKKYCLRSGIDKDKKKVWFCRFRFPKLERICVVCGKLQEFVNKLVCESCKLERKSTPRLPFRIRREPKVEHKIRYDRKNVLRTVIPVVQPRRNTPNMNTHHRDKLLLCNGN